MFEPNLSDETLDEWMQSQDSWPLDKAICLLLRVDPSSCKLDIRRGNPNLPLIFKRALTHTLRAIKRKDLEDLSVDIVIKKSAAHYSVYKKDFIIWARDDWDDDSSHLWAALERYNGLEKKPWRSVQSTQYEITHQAFIAVMNSLTPLERKSISNRKLYRRMKKHAGCHSGIHGLTIANTLLNEWRKI